MYIAAVWFVALLAFIYSIPTKPLAADRKADMLVVLTGGGDRVEHGFDMLAKGSAPVLLISGAGKNVTEERMISEHATQAVRERIYERGGEIILDNMARSTVSNAGQSAAIIKKRKVKSIRLITANYHMNRAVHEFQAALPDIEIIPDPVFPSEFRRNEWLSHGNTRRLVFNEFYKYLAVLMRDLVRPSSASKDGGENKKA